MLGKGKEMIIEKLRIMMLTEVDLQNAMRIYLNDLDGEMIDLMIDSLNLITVQGRATR